MRALIDTNVILDVLFERHPFVDAAAAIWLANEQDRFDGYISAITPINVYYIARKIRGYEVARKLAEEILIAFLVCPIDSSVLNFALTLSTKDYEDAVQTASAFMGKLDAIITRNPEDFSSSPLKVFSPTDFLEYLASVS